MLAIAGEQSSPRAGAAQQNSGANAPPRTGTPTLEGKSNGYTTDVEDEAAGGPKGDLQSHISRTTATPGTEGTGGTAEARALASYKQFLTPPQGHVQEQGPVGLVTSLLLVVLTQPFLLLALARP